MRKASHCGSKQQWRSPDEVTLLLLIRATYIRVLFFAHIPFVVNRIFNATPRGYNNRSKAPFGWFYSATQHISKTHDGVKHALKSVSQGRCVFCHKTLGIHVKSVKRDFFRNAVHCSTHSEVNSL